MLLKARLPFEIKKGEPNLGVDARVFDEHKRDVNGLVHVSDYILASLGDDGILLTWHETEPFWVSSQFLEINAG